MNKKLKLSLLFLTLIIVLTQRLAINIADYQLSIGFIALYIFLLIWLLQKKLLINKKRTLYFFITAIGLLISAWISSSYSIAFSLPSLLLLLALYSPTIFIIKSSPQNTALMGFQSVIFFIAILGILQFFTQIIGIPYRDWLNFIPEENIIANFNYSILVSRGSNLYKSNGIFLSEPSFLSQFVALSILIEIYLFRRYLRLFVLVLAFALSFSGTGIILLTAGLFPLIFQLKIKTTLITGTITAIIFAAFFLSGYGTYTLGRVGEFQNPYSSGYVRFISPYVSYLQLFNEKNTSPELWVGLGPGASDQYNWNTITYFNSPMKLIVEYGIFGILFFLYITYVFFNSGTKNWLSLAAFIMYVFLSGGLLTPQIFVIYYLILFLHQKNGSKSITKVAYEK
jgi:hypothetical protein